MPMIAAPPRLERFLPLLACPACHGSLNLRGERLTCTACGARYDLNSGRPVFLSEPAPVKVMPEGHLSNQPPAEVLDWLTWLNGPALNIGAGGTLVRLENCIELEHAIFRHTDLVADAHRLPFRDAVFDAVVSFNTFEHLSDPAQAAGEILRVLKPGGKLVLHTAFLQPLHEAPYHFYNTTEFGLRRWFEGFQIAKLSVSDNFNPAFVLAWLSSEILRAAESSLGREAAQQLAASPLSFWRSTWEDGNLRDNPLWDLLRKLPQEIQKRFAAGFQLEATRPRVRPVLGDDKLERVGKPHAPTKGELRVAFVLKPGVHDAAALRYRGFNVIEALQCAGIEATHFDEELIPEELARLLAYDLIVLVRRQFNENIGLLLNAAERAGVPVLFDIDDYVFEDDVIPHVEWLRGQPPESARAWIKAWRTCLDRCGYFTGSTPMLVDRADALGKISYRVRNGLNRVQLELSRQARERKAATGEDGDVRLGYFSGTRTHQADFRLIAPVLLTLLDELPRVRLVVVGDFDLDEFPEFRRFPDRVESRPFVDWRALPAEIGRADINLIPLAINPFTECKSDLKYYEAGLLQIPSVASPTRVLAQSITHGINGFLAHTPEEWYQAIKALIDDSELRRQTGQNAYRHVLKEYLPEVVAQEAAAAYRDIIRRHRFQLDRRQ